MAIAMRLARGGRKGVPFYRIVVTDKRMARDGRFIEKVGVYNPLLANDDEKRVVLNEDRVKHWLANGAQPSERVAKLLAKQGLVAAPVVRETPKKSAPSEKTTMRVKEKEEKKAAAAEAAKAAAEQAKAEEEAAKAAPADEAPAAEAPAAEAPAAEAPATEAPAAEEPKA